MHEYSLMQRIVEAIRWKLDESGAGERSVIQTVHLTVGALDIHAEESFRQAYEVLIRETPFAGARLDLTIAPAHYTCRCGHRGHTGAGEADPHDSVPYVECPRCGAVCPLEGGRGVLDIKLTVAEADGRDLPATD